MKLKAFDTKLNKFVPQGEIIYRDYGDTSIEVYPNCLEYAHDELHNGEPQRDRFVVIRGAEITDKAGIEIFECDIRQLNGKIYFVACDGFRFRFVRNMVHHGENESIVMNEDNAYQSIYIKKSFEK